AYSVEDLVAEALREGAYGIMYKPLDIDQVVGFIDKIEEGGLVLVTDDDPATCETLLDVLKLKGYSVATAESGGKAIELTGRNNFDVIIIDIKMPVMNGLETYRALKELKPNVRAVMITGYPEEVGDLAEQALKEDAYTVLYKPFEPEKLLRVVDMIREGRSKEEVKNIR
ncbi:response regulator, partial [Candidatus Bathyarchaeota archaeon]|nr:response regulator [Candidatus Bathyarchaeota archaeon]